MVSAVVEGAEMEAKAEEVAEGVRGEAEAVAPEVVEEVPAAAELPAVFWQVGDEFAGMTLDASGAWVEANLDEDT